MRIRRFRPWRPGQSNRNIPTRHRATRKQKAPVCLWAEPAFFWGARTAGTSETLEPVSDLESAFGAIYPGAPTRARTRESVRTRLPSRFHASSIAHPRAIALRVLARIGKVLRIPPESSTLRNFLGNKPRNEQRRAAQWSSAPGASKRTLGAAHGRFRISRDLSLTERATPVSRWRDERGVTRLLRRPRAVEVSPRWREPDCRQARFRSRHLRGRASAGVRRTGDRGVPMDTPSPVPGREPRGEPRQGPSRARARTRVSSAPEEPCCRPGIN